VEVLVIMNNNTDEFFLKTLFICQTPLHFLLATLLMQTEKKEITFVWVEESVIDADFIQYVININKAKLIKLNGGGEKGKIGRTLQKLSNIRELKSFLLKNNFSELFVFNDLTPEAQFLINEIHQNGGHIYLGEDGVALYETAGIIKANILNKLFGKLVYGMWWSSKDKIGLNPRIKTIYACKPELVRSEIALHRSVLGFPRPDIQCFQVLFKSIIESIMTLGNFMLFILPLSGSVTIQEINSFLMKAAGGNVKLGLKFHPREHDERIKLITENIPTDSYIMVPKGLPAEYICMLSPPPMMVIGCRSSALHIINTLFTEIEVRYFEPSVKKDSAKWENFYKEMGVQEFIQDSLDLLQTTK